MVCIALETRFVSVFFFRGVKEARFLEFAFENEMVDWVFFNVSSCHVFFGGVGVGFDRDVNRETHIRKKEFCLSS